MIVTSVTVKKKPAAQGLQNTGVASNLNWSQKPYVSVRRFHWQKSKVYTISSAQAFSNDIGGPGGGPGGLAPPPPPPSPNYPPLHPLKLCSNYNNAKWLQHVAAIVSVIRLLTLGCMYISNKQLIYHAPFGAPCSLWPLPSVNAGADTLNVTFIAICL